MKKAGRKGRAKSQMNGPTSNGHCGLCIAVSEIEYRRLVKFQGVDGRSNLEVVLSGMQRKSNYCRIEQMTGAVA